MLDGRVPAGTWSDGALRHGGNAESGFDVSSGRRVILTSITGRFTWQRDDAACWLQQ